MKAHISLSILLVSFALSETLQASWWWPPTQGAAIVPEQPTTNDSVTITLSGQWPDSCVPTGSSVRVLDRDIFFDVYAHPPAFCFTVITDWEQTQTVGPLQPGHYRVYARLLEQNAADLSNDYILLKEFDVRPSLPDWLDAFHIKPPVPTNEDKITITLEGTWPNSCVPQESHVIVHGNEIFFYVTAHLDPFCTDVPTPWEHSQTIEPLEAGIYKLYGILDRPYLAAPIRLELLTEFEVTEAGIELPFWLEEVTIVPPEPTSQDQIFITLAGVWPDTCAPVASAVHIDGQNVFFHVILPFSNGCGDFPTPWQFTHDVGPLPAGDYKLFGILNHPLILSPTPVPEAPLIPVLIAKFHVRPVQTETTIYRFLPQESSLHVTGGFAGVNETVPVAGRFQFTVDPEQQTATFDRVKAYFGSADTFPSGDLGALFHMTELEGEVGLPGQAMFHGVNEHGHLIHMEVYYITDSGRTIVTGELPAELVCCDFFHYELYAVAQPVHPCIVDLHFLAHWLDLWPTPQADLDGSGHSDLLDFSLIAQQWLHPCPFDWPW